MSYRFPVFCNFVLAGLLTVAAANTAYARDASFLDPGSSAGVGEEAVKVDPKAEIDVGETGLNVAKRTSVFFVNQTNLPVKIEKVSVNSDSDVTAEAGANDCTKQGVIAPLSRCSVDISVTPTSPGSWNVDVLMTHNGAGRITRAKLSGKTPGVAANENKSTGLAVNAKEVKPIDFGDINVGDGKTVRSTLMVNDSPQPITIYAIDVIEADNGLQRLEQGCAVDMELAPGASCPVTLLWVPKTGGPVSTDLIIRHSGKMGFAVIPVRGVAKNGSAGGSMVAMDSKASAARISDGAKDLVPLPPSAKDLEKEVAARISPVSDLALTSGASGSSGSGSDGSLHLIGTIGERAILLMPNGETQVVAMGGDFTVGSKKAKVIAVSGRSADLVVDGKKKTLPLEVVAMLVAKANEQAKLDAAYAQSKGGSASGGGAKK